MDPPNIFNSLDQPKPAINIDLLLSFCLINQSDLFDLTNGYLQNPLYRAIQWH